MNLNEDFQEYQKGISALKNYNEKKASEEYKKGDITDPFINPANWPVLLEGLKVVIGLFVGLFSSIFGIKGAKFSGFTSKFQQIIDNQNEALSLERKKVDAIEAIRQHLENTCMTPEKAKELVSKLQNSIDEKLEKTSDQTAHKVTADLLGRTKITTKFERTTEDE